MPKFARLEAGQVAEIRDFHPDTPPDAEIAHKGVRWLPYEEEPLADFDGGYETAERANAVEATRVVLRPLRTQHPLQAVIEASTAGIRARYREAIIDALPDLDAVARIAAERDALIAEVASATDLPTLKLAHAKIREAMPCCASVS